MDDGFTAITRAIEVTVQPFFLEDQSDPEEGRYTWAYRVRVRNQGTKTVQLIARTWRIIDGRGQIMEVQGPGVVGEQPILEPNEAFEYTSGTPLNTPSGFMQGTYQMTVVDTGESFDIVIPAFSLDSPYAGGQVH